MTCTCIVYRYNLKRAEQHCRINSSLQLVIVTLHIRVHTTAGGAGGSGSGSTHAHTHTHTQTRIHRQTHTCPGRVWRDPIIPLLPAIHGGMQFFFVSLSKSQYGCLDPASTLCASRTFSNTLSVNARTQSTRKTRHCGRHLRLCAPH